MGLFVEVNEKVHVTGSGVVATHHAAKHSNVPRVMLR
jgi:hypothetical protein